MALVQCPECQEKVSSTAFKCPQCGFQISKPKRSFMGKLFKGIFIVFNALMLIWLVGGMNAVGQLHQTAGSSAEQAGVAIGAGMGMTMILTMWVFGDIILGLFVLLTRPKA